MGRTDLGDWERLRGAPGEIDGAGATHSGGRFGAGGVPSGGDGSGGAVVPAAGGAVIVSGSGGEGTGGTPPGAGGSPTTMNEIYVDCEWPTSPGTGESWASPWVDPSSALRELHDGGTIYIKEGTCAPTSLGLPVASIPASREVTIQGGFTGNVDNRFEKSGNPTTFTADYLDNDVGSGIGAHTDEFRDSHVDNSKKVLIVETSATLWFQDLKLTGAHDLSEGLEENGCLYAAKDARIGGQRLTISGCTSYAGAAAFLDEGTRLSADSLHVIENRSLSSQGALMARGARIDVVDSLFEGNEAPYGAAIWLERSPLTAETTEFMANYAYSHGGAIHVTDSESSALVWQSEFRDNRAAVGGAIATTGGATTIRDSHFWNNTAQGNGGHLHVDTGGRLAATGSYFIGGSAYVGGQVSNYNSRFDCSNSHFINGSAFALGGMLQANGSGTDALGTALSRCSVIGATAPTETSAISVKSMVSSWESTVFLNNGAAGLPVVGVWGNSLTMHRSSFRDNWGEAALQLWTNDALIGDCYFGGHESETTGALLLRGGSTLELVGSTLADNTANGSSTPALTVVDGSTLEMSNTVVWSDATPSAAKWIDYSNMGNVISTLGTCGPAELANHGTSTAINASPFANTGAHMPRFLNPASTCVNTGDDALATAHILDWNQRSAVFPFAADTNRADPGIHSSLDAAQTRQLTPTLSGVTWTLGSFAGNWPCRLIVPSQGTSTPVGSSGTLLDSTPAGTEYIFICESPDTFYRPIVMRTVK